MITEFEVLNTYSKLKNGHYGEIGSFAHHKTCSLICVGSLLTDEMDEFRKNFKDELWDWFLQSKDYYYNSLHKNL
jgi:hypothetical protein